MQGIDFQAKERYNLFFFIQLSRIPCIPSVYKPLFVVFFSLFSLLQAVTPKEEVGRKTPGIFGDRVRCSRRLPNEGG